MADGLVRSFVRGSLIGTGGFGAVYQALNSENGNLVAVKSVEYCNEESWSASELRALENEINIFKSIDQSPHVVQYLGSSKTFEKEKWMLNLFLEYMPGGSLADVMERFGGCLGESLVRTYTRGILQGLHYLHSNGITHCDVKGRNILLGCSGVKLADLGAAKIRLNVINLQNKLCDKISNIQRRSDVTQMKGTLLWMAPEVVRQEEQGPASDIWSLGCTIIEMATGKAPWPNLKSAAPVAALFHIGRRDEIPQFPASLSLEGQDFLHKCLCRNPKERWSTSQLLKHPFAISNNILQPALMSPSSVLENCVTIKHPPQWQFHL